MTAQTPRCGPNSEARKRAAEGAVGGESGASALLARLAANPAAVERVCGSLQRIDGGNYDPERVRQALMDAAADLNDPPERRPS